MRKTHIMSRLALILGAGAGVLALVPLAATAISGHRSPVQALPAKLGNQPVLPVVFEPSPGSSSVQVRYVSRAPRSALYLTRSRVVLALRDSSGQDLLTMRFQGAEPGRINAERRLPGVSNYLIGPDPRRWRTHVPQFAAVRYTRLYPGIDLVVHGAREARLEYDFRLQPGADSRRIRLAFDGPRAPRIASDGALVLRLGHGTVRQPPPLAWQTIAGTRKLVPVSYRLAGGIIRFRVGPHNRTVPLLIDPKVVYASYWGGSGAEGCGPVPGPTGNVFVVCGTDSDLPRVGGIQSSGGGEDVYVAKLDRTATHIVYATYLGGPGFDEGDAAAVDEDGHLYVSGFAGPGFPTTPGAFDTSFNGDSGCCGGFFGDGFVAKLSSDGSRLRYSTYIGGSSGERAGVLALGHDGGVAITGFTGSADFPTTAGALRSSFGGGTGFFEGMPLDAFAARLDPTGSRLAYSTYLGGTGDDTGNDVSLDDAGNAYFTGATQSADFPTTPGALKTSLGTGAPPQDAYVTKLDRRGRMVWSTYLGGDQPDRGSAVDVGERNDVYVSGSTRGGFPVTAGAAQGTFGGIRDWFVAKLDRSGSSLDWSTYLGGSDAEGGFGIDPTLRVDHRGNADVVGPTASTDFPTTANAFQTANAGAVDFAVVQLDRDGHLRFSSYLGGSGVDDNAGGFPALDSRGNFYFGYITNSPDFPVTPDAIQPTYGGGDIDGVLVKVDFDRPGR